MPEYVRENLQEALDLAKDRCLSILEEKSPFTDLAEAYGAQQVVYAHCHGHSRFHDSILGIMRGVRYSLVSGDYRQWEPMKVLD